MATYRIVIGSEFQLKDNAVGVGSTTTGLGNLIIDGTLKASGLSASGVTTFVSYSGFAPDEISGKITFIIDNFCKSSKPIEGFGDSRILKNSLTILSS